MRDNKSKYINKHKGFVKLTSYTISFTALFKLANK